MVGLFRGHAEFCESRFDTAFGKRLVGCQDLGAPGRERDRMLSTVQAFEIGSFFFSFRADGEIRRQL